MQEKNEKTCSDKVTVKCKVNSDKYGFYNDPSGFCTGGYGHKIAEKTCAEIDKLPANDLSKKEKDSQLSIKNEGEASALLKKDLKKFVDGVNKAATVCLNQNQFDALVSFAFNVGLSKIDGFGGSTLLKIINSSPLSKDGKTPIFDYKKIRGEFSKWNKSEGKVLDGLTERRTAEADMFEKNPEKKRI